jgi:Prokaryotic cytochrome b561
MHIIQITLKYLRERQPPMVRFLHITILCLVLSQIIVSNFMGFTDNGEISKKTVEYYGTWIHMCTGLSLLPITFVFIFIELKHHGFKYFFPYFYGNFSQIKKDLQQLKRFELPEPSAYGIAAIVQGLGFGALTLVILSGLTWFLSWFYMAPWANNIKELHESLTGLIEAYVVGHGGMGILHLFFELKNQKNR